VSTPSAAEPRSNSGLYTAKISVWLFIVADALFVGMLVVRYAILRANATDWMHGYEVLSLFRGSMVPVIAGLVCVVHANLWDFWIENKRTKTPAGLFSAFFLGLWIVGVSLLLIRQLNARPSAAELSTAVAIMTLLLGVQAVHVAVGTLATAWLFFTYPKEESRYVAYANRLEVVGLYWQFVGLLTLVVFALVYVV